MFFAAQKREGFDKKVSPKKAFFKVVVVVRLLVDESNGLQRTLDLQLRHSLGLPRPVVKGFWQGRGMKKKTEKRAAQT